MKILLFLFLLSCNLVMAQQEIRLDGVTNSGSQQGFMLGDKSPALKFVNVLNSSNSNFSLAAQKGKVVILEFWATWCGSCIPAMSHLSDLKTKFGDKMEVLAISDDRRERIERFIKNKPSKLLFVSDPDHKLQQYFPYNSIPHSVIIDTEGKIAAITSPTEINEQVVQTLLAGDKINLKQKVDAGGGFDMLKDYFPKPIDFDGYSFDIQPPIPGGFPITKRMAPASPWYGRRVTMMNNPVNLIFKAAFEKSIARIVYEGVTAEEFDHRTTKSLYSIDVIVPKNKENELYSYFRKQLLSLDLEYKCRIEKRKMQTVIITCIDPSKLNALQSSEPATSGSITNQQVTRANNYQKKNAPLSDLFLHFESFGILKEPVIDETGLVGNFNLVFNLDLEDPASFKNELAKLGLKAQRMEREVEVLVIYKD